MAEVTIKIVQEQHFIEGDRFHAYLIQGENTMIIACNVKPLNYLEMCEKLDGLKIRLQELGNKVRTLVKFESDPNFETEADADEYLNNKGC